MSVTRIGWPMLFARFLLTGADTSCGEEMLSGFLQVSVNMSQLNRVTATVPGLLDPHGQWIWMKAIDQGNHAGQVAYQPEKVTHLLHFLGQLSRGLVILIYFCLLMMVLGWLLYGLPTKAQQDEGVKDGCSRTWWIFLCSTYGFVYFSTDQYAPSLPQMGVDLSGSQWLMSATVQFNCITKALMGLVIAGISDQVGRRPVMVGCLSLLAMASFCCACASSAGWFLASRFLQGLGESVEPVVFATSRDYFAKPEDRMMVITVVQLVGSVAQMVAPIFGGFSSVVFGWRFSFFCLALVWGLHAAYAARYMLESCPNSRQEKEEEGSYSFGLRKICTPGPLCLLFTEFCAVIPFMVFTSNIGYVTQVNYGLSAIGTSFCMLSWAVIDAVGVIGTQCLQSTTGLSIPQISRMMMVTFGLTGILSVFLGSFSEDMWSYLTASFLQGMLYSPALVLLNVLYFEPLDDCAGLAAAFEIVAQDLLPTLYSMVCTQSLIHSGVKTYMQLQSVGFVAAPVFYLGYELVQHTLSLPPVAHESDVYKDPDPAG